MAQICHSYKTQALTLPEDCSDDNYNFDDVCEKLCYDLFDDFSIDPFPSIQADVAKVRDDSDALSIKNDIKTEVRNTNCMWSANTNSAALSTSASSSFSDTMTTAVPLAAVMSSSPMSHMRTITSIILSSSSSTVSVTATTPPTVVVANNQKASSWSRQNSQFPEMKTEILDDDYEQQLQHHSIPNSKTIAASTPQQNSESMKHIPPGTSLLRKSNQQQQQQKKLSNQTTNFTRSTSNPLLTTVNQKSSTRNSSSWATSAMCMRPDTPTSLDDDVTIDMKHGIDISACVWGSNSIPLHIDHAHYINHLTQELQDTTKKQIDSRLITSGHNSLSEVLDVIDKDTDSCYTTNSSSSTNTHMRNSDSDSEDEGTTGYGSSESTIDDVMDMPQELSQDSIISDSSSLYEDHQHSRHHHHHQPSYLHSDHSYTRCKDGMDDLGRHTTLETPSDSDEEIDVVNVNDKKLPTNPSDKDRRELQSKVADKISNARIVKTANGIKTIPGRRVSYDLPYTPASSSPVKSVSNSRYPSPASTPYHNILAGMRYVNEKSRKRTNDNNILTVACNVINGNDYILPPSKKNRGKKMTKLIGSNSLTGSSSNNNNNSSSSSSSPNSGTSSSVGLMKRQLSLDETADSIEKRNLHNDMERQRRIGLKNLFESLKKEIPTIKDKERAPKVNILREAAKLCEALTREDQQLNEQRTFYKLQLKKRQELLARLNAMQLRD